MSLRVDAARPLDGCRSRAPPAGTDRRTAACVSISASSTGSASITTSSAPRFSSSSRHLGLGLAQFDAQVGIAALQRRQNLRQHIGRERGDDAELQPSGQQPAAVPGEVHQVAGRGQHLLGPARDLDADVGEGHLARPALDQCRRRARAPAPGSAWTGPAGSPRRPRRPCRSAGGAASARQITQLPQRDHRDKIF